MTDYARYYPVWKDDPPGATPIIAAALNNMDAGIDTAHSELDLKANLASPAFTGNPTAPTPLAGDNDTSLATTAFVQTAVVSKAPLASPAFTGNPTAPTPAAGDNDTSIATTAFVQAAAAAAAASAPSAISLNGAAMQPAGGSQLSVTFGGAFIQMPGTAGSNPSAWASLVFPDGWATYNVDAWWAPMTADAGTVIFRFDRHDYVAGAAPSAVAAPQVTSNAPGVANQLSKTALAAGIAVPASKTAGFNIYRIDADTYPLGVMLFQVVFTKAS